MKEYIPTRAPPPAVRPQLAEALRENEAQSREMYAALPQSVTSEGLRQVCMRARTRTHARRGCAALRCAALPRLAVHACAHRGCAALPCLAWPCAALHCLRVKSLRDAVSRRAA